MKKISKAILITILIMSALILFNTKEVNAGLQSNPNTNNAKKVDTPTNWIKSIREIETTGGAMGFSETIDSTTLKATSNSNGIDIHMMKATEYGAIAILSASGYGNPSNDIALTTTGNKTGVIINQSYVEWNAGGLEGNIFPGVSSKYYNTYTGSNTSARVGDALGDASTNNPGCAGWHSASMHDWFRNPGFPYFLRHTEKGFFSFSDSGAGYSYYARGVAVVGQGF